MYGFYFTDTVPNNNEEMPAFLQVGSWVYPLIPGKSPILKSNEGSFLFPDLDDSIEGNAIGLILPPDILDIEKQRFEAIIQELTTSKKEDLSEYDQYLEYSGTKNWIIRRVYLPLPKKLRFVCAQLGILV